MQKNSEEMPELDDSVTPNPTTCVQREDVLTHEKLTMEVLHVNQNISFSHNSFLIFGFPQITESRTLLLIPFLSIYIVILLANSLLTYRIWVEKTLQSLMYKLISILFMANLSCTSTSIPPFLLSLAFGQYWISLPGCLVQMFFIYFTIVFESSVVLLMALDRYVAICRPLHYHSIITTRLLVQLVLLSLLRSVITVSPIVIPISKVNFCGSNIIQGFACENMVVLNLGCGDISKLHIIGLVVRILIFILDGSLIFFSYVAILRTTSKIVKGDSLKKTLHTCSTHIIVAMLIYSCGFASSIVYRMGNLIPMNIQNLTSALYFLFPATMNPFIYGLRMTEIRVCLVKAYGRNKMKGKPVAPIRRYPLVYDFRP
ncbi:olfactory receptor 52E8-like [Hyperolius riggenbachi]|uniref:olfactory receptor 52E8-like n=1 Tax=Hyperolius riggenbachi TaxID=752182 RepID=UPI0035A3A60C